MTELSSADLLAALDLTIKALTVRAKVLRASVEANMGATRVERLGAYIAGEKLAAIERQPGNVTARVADESAAIRWCGERYPGELEERLEIRAAFLGTILEFSQKNGRPGGPGLDPKTGEALDWITIERGSPYVKVYPSEDGVAFAHKLYGELLDALTTPSAAASLGDRAFSEIAQEKRDDDQ